MTAMRAFVSAAALLLACAGDDRQEQIELPGTAVPITEVPVYYSGYVEPVRLVIRSQAEWENAWAVIHSELSEAPPVPAVGFGAEMIVLAATGTRPTGGYSVALPIAALDGETLRVAVVESTPGNGCAVSMATTQPVAVARVARQDGAVEFVESTVVGTCD